LVCCSSCGSDALAHPGGAMNTADDDETELLKKNVQLQLLMRKGL
jgi:hypothetical protein